MKSIYEWFNKRIFSKSQKEITTDSAPAEEENFEELIRAIDETSLSDRDDEANPATGNDAPATATPPNSASNPATNPGTNPAEESGKTRRQLKTRSVSGRKN